MDGIVKGESRAHLAASHSIKQLPLHYVKLGADLWSDIVLVMWLYRRRCISKSQISSLLISHMARGTLYMNEKVPSNDGGLSLGQLWIGNQKKLYTRVVGYLRVLSFVIQLIN